MKHLVFLLLFLFSVKARATARPSPAFCGKRESLGRTIIRCMAWRVSVRTALNLPVLPQNFRCGGAGTASLFAADMGMKDRHASPRAP